MITLCIVRSLQYKEVHMNKFKKGDWVRAIVDRYSRTTYMKPCKIIKVIDDNIIEVITIDTNEVWEVESKNFDYCPVNHILHKGDDIGKKDTLI